MNSNNEITGISECNPARLVLYRMSNSPFADVSENKFDEELLCETDNKVKEHKTIEETCSCNSENIGK